MSALGRSRHKLEKGQILVLTHLGSGVCIAAAETLMIFGQAAENNPRPYRDHRKANSAVRDRPYAAAKMRWRISEGCPLLFGHMGV